MIHRSLARLRRIGARGAANPRSTSARRYSLYASPMMRGARTAIAVGVERRQIGRADVGDDVHLHAVDDGQKILAREAELPGRIVQAAQTGGRAAVVERGDVLAPLLELGETQIAVPRVVR